MTPLFFTPGMRGKARRKRALETLNQVGIGNLASRSVTALSGGQKQRVAIARALVNHPRLLLADEPTGALDQKTSAEIMALLHALSEQGHTLVVITHDPAVAAVCDRLYYIQDGTLRDGSAADMARPVVASPAPAQEAPPAAE